MWIIVTSLWLQDLRLKPCLPWKSLRTTSTFTFHSVVCLEEFELGGEARHMPCKHMFRFDYVLSLKLHNLYPVCFLQMLVDDKDDDIEKWQESNPIDESRKGELEREVNMLDFEGRENGTKGTRLTCLNQHAHLCIILDGCSMPPKMSTHNLLIICRSIMFYNNRSLNKPKRI
jgi:hypothetical protein